MSERDYPEGHPAAPDYKGQKYVPPRAPWSEDFPPGHPARDGQNVTASDTPDGLRAEHLERERAVQGPGSERYGESRPDVEEA